MIKAIFKTGGDGVCIGYSRDPQAGEYALETTPQEWVYQKDYGLYKDEGGTFTPMSGAEVSVVLAARQAAIDDAAAEDQALDDEYTGTGFATITVPQADAYVQSGLPADVTNVATAKQAIIHLRDICNKQNRMLIWMREEVKKRL